MCRDALNLIFKKKLRALGLVKTKTKIKRMWGIFIFKAKTWPCPPQISSDIKNVSLPNVECGISTRHCFSSLGNEANRPHVLYEALWIAVIGWFLTTVIGASPSPLNCFFSGHRRTATPCVFFFFFFSSSLLMAFKSRNDCFRLWDSISVSETNCKWLIKKIDWEALKLKGNVL